MNPDRVAGVRFAGYGEYLQACQLAERLTQLNPKLPIQLVLTSWYPKADMEDQSGPETLDGTRPVFADVRCESPSRLEHFVEMLAQLHTQMRQLNQQLERSGESKQAVTLELRDETPWLTEYFSQDN